MKEHDPQKKPMNALVVPWFIFANDLPIVIVTRWCLKAGGSDKLCESLPQHQRMTLQMVGNQVFRCLELQQNWSKRETELWDLWKSPKSFRIFKNINSFLWPNTGVTNMLTVSNYVTHDISCQPTRNIANYYSETLPTWWGRGLWGLGGGQCIHMDTIMMVRTTECMM